jgi:hypothetical protein
MPGKRGNTNALKHGLYAKKFRAEEVAALRKMDPSDYKNEIALLRVKILNILDELEAASEHEKRMDLYDALFNAVGMLNTTARTDALINGDHGQHLTAIEEALRMYR